MKNNLCKEAFKTATLVDGLTVIKIDGVKVIHYEHWCGCNPTFANHLQVWGAAGTVKLCDCQSGKLMDCGEQCMMVGYALDHHGDTYQMWHMNTNRAH